MAVKVTVVLNAPDDAITGYGVNARIQLQRAASEAFSTPTDVGETLIVAGTYRYEIWDAAGDATSWYRWRLESDDDTETGDWSDPLQGVEAAEVARASGAFASLDDLLLRVSSIPQDTRRLAAMEKALVESADRIRHVLGGWAFWRSPQSGTTQRTFRGTGTDLLHVHAGIVSLTTVEIRETDDGAWVTVDASDWQLLCKANPQDEFSRPSGEPWDHLQLTGVTTYSTFPRGRTPRVRLTGAFEWDPIPPHVVGANVDWARQQLAADPSFPGGIVGPDELGRPVGPNRMPDSVWRLLLWQQHRFSCAT